MAVGNVVKATVHRRPHKLWGMELPPILSFLAPPAAASAPFTGTDGSRDEVSTISLDAMMEQMDDECYLGKHGNMEECVDFDPLH